MILEAILLILEVFIFPGFLFLLLMSFFIEWYKRKLFARMQNRVGPKYIGYKGLLQPIADFFKLLSKEVIELERADNHIIDLSLLVASSIFIYVCFFLPFAGKPLISFEGDLIAVLLLTSAASFMLFAIGWSMPSPYGMIGGMRLLAQVIGFEIPYFMLALVPAYMTRSLSIFEIGRRIWPSLASNPAYLIPWSISVLLFLITTQVELEEAPFHIPDAEQELVAGYFTELSGRRLALLDLAKDTQLLFCATFMASIFFGAGSPFCQSPLLCFITTIIESLAIVFFVVAIKASAARLAISNVLDIMWKYLAPSSALVLAISLLLGGV
ncbi:MAG: complex I subunit 1 family protein [Candidatus Methanodesulfokora sp.]|nr:MAG: hypothetical protein C0200_05630 [Candidatus Korarchaeota archaeon]